MISIVEALRNEADERLHHDLHDFASMLINESNDNKPLHDTGERFINVQEAIDEYRDELNATSKIKLRRVTVEYNCDLGYYAAFEPLPPLPLMEK